MEKINQPTAFAQQFFDTVFDSAGVTVDTGQDLNTSQIPAVEITGFDTQLLSQLQQRCQELSFEFKKIATVDMLSAWHSDSLGSGWDQICVKNTMITFGDHELPVYEETLDKPLINILQQLLDPVWSDIISLKINRLRPGGWVAPHQDQFDQEHGLRYFWMPINSAVSCIKAYPWGWLQHQIGNMYLFNQSKYMHAAYNSTNQDRFVLIGRIQNSLHPYLWSWHQRKAYEWSRLWSPTRTILCT